MANPIRYTQANKITHSRVQYLLDEFEEELIHMSGKCMDIGCGPGDLTRYILLPTLDPKAVVIGTDISEDMIRHAKKLHADEQRLKFEVLDIETKHLPEKYVSDYDHVFTFHALHWCIDMRLVFENIYRLLRPGGTVFILTVLSHDAFDILCELSQDIRYTSYVTQANNFIPIFCNSDQPHKELKAVLKSVGFNVHHCSYRERSFSIQYVQKLPDIILSIVTQFLKDMPRELMAQFKIEFTQEYTKRRFSHKRMSNGNEKIISDIHEILVVYAQKGNKI